MGQNVWSRALYLFRFGHPIQRVVRGGDVLRQGIQFLLARFLNGPTVGLAFKCSVMD